MFEHRFQVRSPRATHVWLCLFDGEVESRRLMSRNGDEWFCEARVREGARYGFRAAGSHPFDPSKLLLDPNATHLDAPFTYDPRLSEPGFDTAALVPKAVLTRSLPPLPAREPVFKAGGLIYEVNVRAFTMRHPDIPSEMRGTVAALAHRSILDHLTRIGVDAVELMPIVAWIDERHLPPLGLSNAWGYNPVVPMALDPRLCPGGMEELRATVEALRQAGIGTILDLVFNHTGESDLAGPTLSLRGLDDDVYARSETGVLINDAGTGNTLDFGNPWVRAMTLRTLRHFVSQAGVDGFRFDLAPIVARSPGFDPQAPIFSELRADPLLADRIMIAEPWDVGPGGYQLGAFPSDWLEWNDRFRDDVRRFWRGDGAAGAIATRLAGSTDVFGEERTRSVNFVAAHDGFTLADAVSYRSRHNHANGEQNRDGHADEVSWNAGNEGRGAPEDVRALLASLFAARGTIMLTAGDEFGRTQAGNNNAYAQDNEISWLDWDRRDHALEAYVASLAAWRRAHPAIGAPEIRHDLHWSTLDGGAMMAEDWERAHGFVMQIPGGAEVRIDRVNRSVDLSPSPRE
ncbi:glycogen debranching enzyme [Sphingomonas sp. IC-11]|uniref:glycogen debranching protein n=1 Tax=Sphingomonas sp. IC-11 TaxID=2898528 RepID=UPI001E487625|nr:alpha-amylase family glycosyl hydrolase [Sphingomonas sp. IC-11]MCD2315977.1 glycogen debranching enzyme [Sphingomonas sp. IC-11]